MRWITRAAAVWFLSVAAVAAAEVLVLKGGARIELKSPPLRQGNNILLTRLDGTLFSVPDADVDWKATAAARKEQKAASAPAAEAPSDTPAEAARHSRQAPKARVRLTDSDVDHVTEPEESAESATNVETRSTVAHVEVADYTQEQSGANLMVRGSLRNIGATAAQRVSMSVIAMDAAGKGIGSVNATLSKGDIGPGESVSFTALVPVAGNVPQSIRFAPLWRPAPSPAAPNGSPGPNAPAAAAAAPGSPAAAPAPASAPPRPAPTPYGLGSLYAAPAPSASEAPPADGQNGYLPGAARKEDQPKPPQ